jgi:hypothetical protein
MAPSGMLRRMALVITDVSEERSASFIRVTSIDELRTTLVVTRKRSSEISVLTRATRRNIQEDAILLFIAGSRFDSGFSGVRPSSVDSL